jgi:hypothetical protein
LPDAGQQTNKKEDYKVAATQSMDAPLLDLIEHVQQSSTTVAAKKKKQKTEIVTRCSPRI